MSNQTEKVFADGFIFKRKENAPEFIVGSQSIKVDEAIAFLQLNQKNSLYYYYYFIYRLIFFLYTYKKNQHYRHYT